MNPFAVFQLGATVVEGQHGKRLRFEDADAYRMHVESFGVGASLIVSIEEEREHRPKTRDQLAYWFSVPVALVAEHCGMTEQQASHAMLGECFGYREGLGHEIPEEPSVAALSVEKMTHLIDWVLDWAPAHLEVIVPPPDKNWRKNAERIRKERKGRAA